MVASTNDIKRQTLDEETIEKISSIDEGLKSIQMEQAEDNDNDRAVEFLSECMVQNLDHARHIEDERMNFVQIHLVLVGGVLSILAASAFSTKNLIVLIILVSITILGLFIKALIDRWNLVFVAHRTCAMYCYLKIMEICDLNVNPITEFPMDILPDVKRQISQKHRSVIPFYPFTFSQSGKTGKIIRWFTNGLIIVTAIVTMGYFLTYWVL